MYRFFIPFKRNPSSYLKYFTYYNRYYRTKTRKKVSIEFNKPSLYDDKRNAPSKLLKENLFTPESAGYRELPMLCFWIVNYGYADSSILTRYVQCTIDNIKKLKIKSIALIFHSVSKYLYNSTISFVESHQIVESDVEFKNRDDLIKMCIQLILQSSPLLPNLFVNAVPKDLGMISLSIMNIYEMFLNECNTESWNNMNEQLNIEPNEQNNQLNKNNDKNNKSDLYNTKSIGSVVNKLLQKLSKEIIPKLPFCEIDEFSAFAKSFSKINTDWSRLFMRELSLEVSSLLLDKIEDLEMLKHNKFIGEDLIDGLNKLPKELCTITCSLSKCKINEPRFWERSQKALDLLLEMKDKNFGIKDIDIKTLTLLCTSMANYSKVSKLVEELFRITSNDNDQQSILIGFNISLKNLKNKELAEKFLCKVNVDKIIDYNPKLVSQFILNLSRSGLIDNPNDHLEDKDKKDNENTPSSYDNSNITTNTVSSNITKGIINMLNNDIDVEILSAIFVSSRALGLSMGLKLDLCNRLYLNLDYLESYHLINILLNSIYMLNGDFNNDININGFCKRILDIIYNRCYEIPLNSVTPILYVVIDYFGGNLELIKRLCSRIDLNFNDFNMSEVSNIFDKLSAMRINVNKLFNKNINKIRDFNKLNKIEMNNTKDFITDDINNAHDVELLHEDLTNMELTDNTPYEFGLYGNVVNYDEDVQLDDINQNYNKDNSYNNNKINKTKFLDTVNKLKFSDINPNEVSQIAKYTHTRSENTTMFISEDFLDMSDSTNDNGNIDNNNTFKFELTKYQTNLDIEETYNSTGTNTNCTNSKSKISSKPNHSNRPSGSTIDDLKKSWSELRHLQ